MFFCTKRDVTLSIGRAAVRRKTDLEEGENEEETKRADPAYAGLLIMQNEEDRNKKKKYEIHNTHVTHIHALAIRPRRF